MWRRDIVIGDLHGCLVEFENLLKRINYDPAKDRLVIAGDVFDRGPYSVECLRRMMELNAIFVLGNHDEKHLRYATHEQKKRKNPRYKNPMKPFSGQRLEIQNALTETDFEYLSKAPHIYQLNEKWIVVHAGLENIPLSKQGAAVLRVRFVDNNTGLQSKLPGSWDQPPNSTYWADVWKGPKSVIYGHNVHSLTEPKVTKAGPQFDPYYTMGIDTGACFGGKLTAAILQQGEFVGFEQVQALHTYKPLNNPNSHKE